MPTLCAAEQPARLLAEGDQPARREVEHRGRQRPSGRRAVHDHRPGRGGQVGRRGRHQDRRVVEVDRVLAEPPPVEERPAGQAEEDDRRADEPEDRVDLARRAGGPRRAPASPPRRPWRGRRPGRRRSPPRGGTAACRCRRSPGAPRSTGRPPRSRDRRTAGPGRARRFGCMSKKMTRPSLKPFRPMPHWSIRARAFASSPRSSGSRRCPGCRRRPRRRSAPRSRRSLASASTIAAGDRMPGVVVDGAVGLGLRERGVRRGGEAAFVAAASSRTRAAAGRTAARRRIGTQDRRERPNVASADHDRPPGAVRRRAPGEPEAAVRLEEDLRRPRPAVVGRRERRRVGARVADRDEVAAAQRRQVVDAERVGRFADRALDAGGFGRGAGRRRSTARPSEVSATIGWRAP